MLRSLIFFIFSLLFTCCENHSNTNLFTLRTEGKPCEDPTIPITVLSSSVSSTNYHGKEFPPCFESVFSDSTFVTRVTECDNITVKIKVVTLGRIKIGSGEIIACDPVVLYDAKPFANIFPVGTFDVQLAIINNRVAFSRIVFSNLPVHSWIGAVLEGQKQVSVKDSTSYCYGVDAGMGLFIDGEACRRFNLKGQSEWNNVFLGKISEPNYYGQLTSFDTYNLATFRTGYGDGCYGSFIGIDVDGNICRLLTDFEMVHW